MLVEFIVISYNPKCQEYTADLVTKLNRCKNISATIDTNYNQNINTRQNKYKKDEKDIILIDEICLVNNEVIVKYSDAGSRGKRYNKDEFIDLIESFENANNSHSEEEKKLETIEEEIDNNCLIM
jgi:hypothetical protein